MKETKLLLWWNANANTMQWINIGAVLQDSCSEIVSIPNLCGPAALMVLRVFSQICNKEQSITATLHLFIQVISVFVGCHYFPVVQPSRMAAGRVDGSQSHSRKRENQGALSLLRINSWEIMCRDSLLSLKHPPEYFMMTKKISKGLLSHHAFLSYSTPRVALLTSQNSWKVWYQCSHNWGAWGKTGLFW